MKKFTWELEFSNAWCPVRDPPSFDVVDWPKSCIGVVTAHGKVLLANTTASDPPMYTGEF